MRKIHEPFTYDRSVIEPLESRLLLSGGPAPRVTSVVADNRGGIVITFDSAMKTSTMTSKSIQVFTHSTAKGDTQVREALHYETDTHQLFITSAVATNKSYKIKLVSSLLKGDNGKRLDGEFTGTATPSGDGVAGGDYVVKTKVAAQTVARFTTVLGNIDVSLFTTQTPLTVANFVKYANAGDWDDSFFHRLVANGVIQGGGYRVDQDGVVRSVPQMHTVKNEPHPGDPGDIRGTIAMAKLDGKPNSATNQWFFNLGDNSSQIDNENGGFTVFGQITDDTGLAVMDAIGAKGTVNLGAPFDALPVQDAATANKTNPPTVHPATDLILVERVAILMAVARATG